MKNIKTKVIFKKNKKRIYMKVIHNGKVVVESVVTPAEYERGILRQTLECTTAEEMLTQKDFYDEETIEKINDRFSKLLDGNK